MVHLQSPISDLHPIMIITELTASACSEWDAYVENSASGLPQHLSGWRNVLTRTHGYETHYLMASDVTRTSAIVGVLPLFIVRSFLVGNTATTMPGGLCASSDEAALALVARGREIARQAGARRFLIHDSRHAWPVGLQTSSAHVHWIMDLRLSADALWQQLDGNIRRQVRLGRRHGLRVQIDREGRLLGPFYELFSRFTHQAGTPVFGRDFLEHVVEAFPNGFNIAVVYKEHKAIAAYFQLQLGKTVYGTWGAALPEHLALRPVYLAYWEILNDAIANGYHFLDMGRSPTHSNASKFKGQWGGVSRPVYQQAGSLGNGNAASLPGRVQSERRFQLVRRLWPRLPRPVAQYLGPKLRRHVPFA